MPVRGGLEHPVSKRQMRWVHAAERRGEVARGTAKRWEQRVHNRKAAGRPAYGGRR